LVGNENFLFLFAIIFKQTLAHALQDVYVIDRDAVESGEEVSDVSAINFALGLLLLEAFVGQFDAPPAVGVVSEHDDAGSGAAVEVAQVVFELLVIVFSQPLLVELDLLVQYECGGTLQLLDVVKHVEIQYEVAHGSERHALVLAVDELRVFVLRGQVLFRPCHRVFLVVFVVHLLVVLLYADNVLRLLILNRSQLAVFGDHPAFQDELEFVGDGILVEQVLAGRLLNVLLENGDYLLVEHIEQLELLYKVLEEVFLYSNVEVFTQVGFHHLHLILAFFVVGFHDVLAHHLNQLIRQRLFVRQVVYYFEIGLVVDLLVVNSTDVTSHNLYYVNLEDDHRYHLH